MTWPSGPVRNDPRSRHWTPPERPPHGSPALDRLGAVTVDGSGLRVMLSLLGAATFLWPAGRSWTSVHVPRIVGEVALFHLLLFVMQRVLNIAVLGPGSLLESLLLNPVIEELIFRQPLVFLRASRWYWPAGLVLGAAFVLMHDNTSLYALVVRAAGTLLLLRTFRHAGLPGSVLAHTLLNLGVLLHSRL